MSGAFYWNNAMSGISYSMPRFQAIDMLGRPMVGATLYTYQNKTTTPAPTWRDKDQTAYNTNPVVLDARGEAVIWLDPAQVYTFVLRDWFGALVWSQDDIGGASSVDIGFLQTGSGAVRRTAQDKMRESISAADFGAVGNGLVDDGPAILKALLASEGRPIKLAESGIYRIENPIAYQGDVDFFAGGKGATIYSSSQNFHMLKVSGSLLVTHQLSKSMEINGHIWELNSTGGVSPGMLMEVISSKSWYYDPRPESTDARKSELHRVSYVDGLKVVTERCANDGYEIDSETVTVNFYKPISVHFENVAFKMEHELTKAKICVSIEYSSSPEIKNCRFINGSAVGLNLVGCYNTRILGGMVRGTNGAGAAYALKTVGCTDTVVDGTRFYENYAAVDVSGFKVISLDTFVRNTAVYGGGLNNNGQQMGWGENGELGQYQRGHGSHGPSDNAVFENNYLSKLHEAFPCRGRNIRIANNVMSGRYRNAPIRLYDGENAEVIDNICDPSFFGGKSTATTGGNINSRLADNFIDVFETFQSSADSKLVVSGNKALVSGHFMRLYNGASQVAVLASNTIRFRPASGSQASYVVASATGQESSLLPGSSIAFDVLPSKMGSGATKLFDENISFSGIEIHGWSESFQPAILGNVRWGSPTIGAARITLSGRYAEASISISGGTITASPGQDYSVTINVPYKSTWPVSASSVEGIATRYGEAGNVSGDQALQGAVIGLRRVENPGGTSVRAVFRYEIG